MKKLVFIAVVLVAIVGISSSTAQAFWGFSKKANKAEVKNENIVAASVFSGNNNEEGLEPALKVAKKNASSSEYGVAVGGALVKTVTKIGDVVTGFTAEVTLGSFKVDLIIKADEKTKVTRRYDGKGSLLSDIAENHIISFFGDMVSTTLSSLTINAKRIQDFSIQKHDTDYSGEIVGTSTDSVWIKFPGSANENDLKIMVSSSAKIKLDGKIINNLQGVKTGMFVARTKGTVDTSKKPMIMIAKELVIRSEATSKKTVQNEGAFVKEVKSSSSIIVETQGKKVYKLRADNNTYFSKWMLVNGVKQLVSSDFSGLDLKSGDFIWFDGVVFLDDGTANISRMVKDFTGVKRYSPMEQ